MTREGTLGSVTGSWGHIGDGRHLEVVLEPGPEGWEGDGVGRWGAPAGPAGGWKGKSNLNSGAAAD